MATFTGQAGALSVNAVNVAEITSFTIDHTVNTIEATAMGDEYRSYKTGMKEWSGSADVLFDDATLVDGLGTVLIGNTAGGDSNGAAVAIIAYPAGNTSGAPKLTGNVFVTGFSVASEMEGMVTATVSFQGDGILAIADATGS